MKNIKRLTSGQSDGKDLLLNVPFDSLEPVDRTMGNWSIYWNILSFSLFVVYWRQARWTKFYSLDSKGGRVECGIKKFAYKLDGPISKNPIPDSTSWCEPITIRKEKREGDL